ncbi:MAG: nickel-binding protein [Pseudomonadota bacterium]
MSDIFLLRHFDEPVPLPALQAMAEESMGCFPLYRVTWQQSFFSTGEQDLLCHFRGPDAESIRTALRNGDADMRIHFPGTTHDAPGRTEEEILEANVIVHRSFDEPVDLDALQAQEDASLHCLENHRVTFMRTFLSADRRRMACLYKAPDAESVRIAQREAGMPVESAWSFLRISPEQAA